MRGSVGCLGCVVLGCLRGWGWLGESRMWIVRGRVGGGRNWAVDFLSAISPCWVSEIRDTMLLDTYRTGPKAAPMSFLCLVR